MKYTSVGVGAIGYELAPVVVTSEELEERLLPTLEALRIPAGQLEALTGIFERRWWEPGFSVADGAVAAGRQALNAAGVHPSDLEVLIFAGVCREQFEPATACRVAAGLNVTGAAAIFDLSNACLGVLNGMVEIANRIELGQCRAGLVVSCETAREINDVMIGRLLEEPSMPLFRTALATLTGGSGAVAVLLTDGSFARGPWRRLLGGVSYAAPQFHELCRWGLESLPPHTDRKVRGATRPFMSTDSVAVLKHGVALGVETWGAFLRLLGWQPDQVDKVICHQVGASHRDAILRELGIEADRDFSTFESLGNMGTVSLPLTAALAEEREFLRPGDRVGFLGIGSGLNCMMLGLEW
jgi:3-oxoacyl-[acyl-carrier-protein] synthase-3